MFSEALESGDVPGQQSLRLSAAEELAARHFGLDLKKYPTAQVESLLAMLPAVVSHEDEATVSRVLSVCSVGETMFMRHPDQFRALAQIVADGSVGEPNRPLSVWSAGCSTGEEAYSLAALLAGHPGGARVLGTDVSPRSIERAKAGRYRYWSLRGVDPSSAASWLDIDSVNAVVRSPIRNVVDFRVHNLMVDPFPHDVDVIFCRNVLLYFREDAAAEVIEKFYRSLRPSGLLFIGYVDPAPSPNTPLLECHRGPVRYYCKPAAGTTISVPTARSVPPPPPGEILGANAVPLAPRLPSFLRPESPPKRVPPRRSEPPPNPPPEDPAVRERFNQRLSIARGLCAQGARDDALATLASLSIDHPLEIEPYVLSAMIADEGGLRDAALGAARRAYFLAPEAPITPFLLAMCLDQLGERQAAEVRYLEARRALESVDDPLAPLAYAEGMTAFQLRRTIDARIRGA